jgi:hypothetical protein
MLQSNVRKGLCTVQFCHVGEFPNLKVVIMPVTIQESSMNRVHKRFDSYQTKRYGSLIFKKILSWEFNIKRINCSLLVRFTIWFLQMFQGRFAIVARVWLCKSNEWKLLNMKNEPKNTYIPYGPAHVLKSFITTLLYIIIEPLWALEWSYYLRSLAVYPTCCHRWPTLPSFSSPFGASVLPMCMWSVGHLAGLWTVHNCGQNSFWCKRIIHGDLFISFLSIMWWFFLEFLESCVGSAWLHVVPVGSQYSSNLKGLVGSREDASL